MKTYLVYWTYRNRHANIVHRYRANSILDVIKIVGPDPYKEDNKGRKPNFIVFKEGKGLVHEGTIEELGKCNIKPISELESIHERVHTKGEIIEVESYFVNDHIPKTE